jgi:hypothetical protein
MEELKLEARKLERRETKGVITCAAIDIGYYTFSVLKSIKETVMAEILDVLKQMCFEGCEI